ncbi:MAG: hypothetical protein CMJ78_03910 [Planctomycetaceae bacterium]|nr:hypothetical protein [Planctomycetaceae bacterium]
MVKRFQLALAFLLFCSTGVFGQAAEDPLAIKYLEGHTGPIRSVGCTADGQTFVSVGLDGKICYWDRETNALLHTMVAPRGLLRVALSPDGQTAAVGDVDGSVQFAGVPTRHPIRGLSSSLPGNPTSIAVSKDGQFVITGDQSKYVRMWSNLTNAHARDFGGSTQALVDVFFDNEAGHVIGASIDGTVKSWNLADAKVLTTNYYAPSNSMDFHEASKKAVLAGNDGYARVINWPPVLPTKYEGNTAQITAMALSKDGKWLVSGGDEKKVHLYKVGETKPTKTLTGELASIRGLAFDAAGQHVAVGDSGGKVNIFKLDDGSITQTITAHSGQVRCVEFFEATRQLATCGDDGKIKIWTLGGEEEPIESKHPSGSVTSLKLIANGQQVITCGADKMAYLWNVSDGRQLARFVGATATVNCVAVSADGQWLAACGDDKFTRIWPLKNPQGDIQPVKKFEGPSAVRSVAFDKQSILAAGDSGRVHVWDVDSELLIERMIAHGSRISVIQVNSDGSVFSASTDKMIQHQIRSVAAIGKISEHPLRCVRFAPDGKSFVTASDSGAVRQWTLDIQPGHTFVGPTGKLRTISISVDGRWIAAAGETPKVWAWSLADAKALATIDVPVAVNSLAFGKRGEKLVVATHDQILRVFAVNPKDGGGFVVEPFQELKGHPQFASHSQPTAAICFAEDNNTLLSVGFERTLRRWYVSSPRIEKSVQAHQSAVFGLQFSSKGEWLATCGADRQAAVWQLSSLEKRWSQQGPGTLFDVAFDGTDERIAVVGEGGFAQVSNIKDVLAPPPAEATESADSSDEEATEEAGPVKLTMETPSRLLSVAFTKDRSSLLSVGTGKQWHLWLLSDQSLTRSGQGNNSAVYRLLVSPSGARFVTIDLDGHLCVWNVSDGNLLYHRRLPVTAAYDVCYTSGGTEVVVASRDHRLIRFQLPSNAR